VRLAANLFTQRPGHELDDFSSWVKQVSAGQGDPMFRINGGGEMLVYSAADFEDFLEPRPEMPQRMEQELTAVVRLLAENRWPFRLHATYDETIARALDVFEAVNRDVPLKGLHWFIDHAETITQRNIDRIRALEGGIAVQHRMAYQGEYFLDRYGAERAEHAPPIRRMLQTGLPVGAGTDATRVASYNPFISLYWLVAGKTVGGARIHSGSNCLSRMEALALWTHGSAWFSDEQDTKGRLMPGMLADVAVLSADFFSVAEEQVKSLESVLTLVGGKPVYAAAEFSGLAPPQLPVVPEWSPVAHYGGYHNHAPGTSVTQHRCAHGHTPLPSGAAHHRHLWALGGCPCWAF
jgi:predicted amidohydrolase YtcJ